MPIALELFFDEATEAAIRDIWTMLAERGLSRSLLAKNSRPHISVVSSGSADVEAIANAVAGIAANIPISLTSLGIFSGTRNVVFLAPVVTTALLDLHARLYEIYRPHASPVEPYELPSAWVPHCTLATDVSKEHIGAVVEVCRNAMPVSSGSVTHLGLVEVGLATVSTIVEIPLVAH